MYIYGASGHGKVVLDIALNLNLAIAGFVDRNPLLSKFEGYEVIKSVPSKANYIIAIGDNSIRQKIAQTSSGDLLPALIHKHAIIGGNVLLGQGTMVAAGAIINPSVIVKSNCIINTAAVIEHDCVIEDFVHISPNVTLCGSVIVGKGTHVGAGAVIIPGVKIGDWCTIGAGTVVIKDIPNGATVVGNPGRIIKSI
ncbi:acetyltransferase [Nonlabens sp. MB-3u-79]|nr:acetyltransferase [Nonlabens sp. MB-3u-79]